MSQRFFMSYICSAMFGTYRYVLAALVVLSHSTPMIGGVFHGYGLYAVMCFYVLSGYLMTTVLHTQYGFTRVGLLRYATNRALRLFPPYWLVLLLCLVLAGQARFAAYLPPFMQWPIGASAWTKNIF